VWFIDFSKLRKSTTDLYGADTSQMKGTLAKAVHLLNELAVTLSELEEPDTMHQYTSAANQKD